MDDIFISMIVLGLKLTLKMLKFKLLQVLRVSRVHGDAVRVVPSAYFRSEWYTRSLTSAPQTGQSTGVTFFPRSGRTTALSSYDVRCSVDRRQFGSWDSWSTACA